MAPRVLSIISCGAIFLVPIAIVLHSNASPDANSAALDAAVSEDIDASVSLLQKSAKKSATDAHHSALGPNAAKVAADNQGPGYLDQGLKERKKTAAKVAGNLDIAAAFAEYVAMTLFVIIGCGSAMGMANKDGSAWVLQVALTFGLAITVLAYSIGHISGGQINCAVTFALAINGSLGWGQAVLNTFFQLLGSCTGALILSVIYPKDKDLTGNLGSNGVGEGWSLSGALVGEIVGTFVLCFTVLNTAVDVATVANRQIACLAIGLSVFLAHSVLIPIDGCSINPTRSFGPAFVATFRNGLGNKDAKSTFEHMWIFCLGPMTGAAIAVGVYQALNA